MRKRLPGDLVRSLSLFLKSVCVQAGEGDTGTRKCQGGTKDEENCCSLGTGIFSNIPYALDAGQECLHRGGLHDP